MDEESSYWGCFMPFVDTSESFCNGFEAGIVWCDMERGAHIEKKTIHSVNAEQYRLMAKRFSYSLEIEQTEIEGWSYMTAIPVLRRFEVV